VTGATPPRNGFTPAQRLHSGADFERVYAKRWRILGHARLGLSVSGKTVGDSVHRNRVKRQVRESFRMAAPTLPAVDLVVGARNGARTAHNAALRASLESLWEKIRKQCVVS
jgi:ribonuclease P protein component